MASAETQIRRAEAADAAAVARLLDDFNREYEMPTPGVAALAEHGAALIGRGAVSVLLASGPPGAGSGDGLPDGLCLFHDVPSIWTGGVETYVAELYVRPERRGRGIGRALMEATIAAARAGGSSWVHLGTAEDDTAARALYESLGFSNRENGPDGPAMLCYELEL